MNRKYTIDDLRRLAEERGGACLSDEYRTMKDKYRWRCAKGHEWSSQAEIVLNKRHWCPTCARDLLPKLQAFAKSRGGICLSEKYINHDTVYSWRCKNGHFFQARWDRVSDGRKSWCMECAHAEQADNLKKRIEALVSYCKKNGGELLSDYADTQTKVHVRCELGHEWDALPVNLLRRGDWCPTCRIFTTMNTLDHLDLTDPKQPINSSNAFGVQQKAIAAAKVCDLIGDLGGVLVSVYQGHSKKVSIRCQHGHVFALFPRSLRNGAWCPTCKALDLSASNKNPQPVKD